MNICVRAGLKLSPESVKGCGKINIEERERERWVGVGWTPLSFSSS